MHEYVIWGEPEYKGKIRETPVPHPGPREVLIKVVASGLNPKDWKLARNRDEAQAINAGDDMSGVVAAVGSRVFEYKKGDRVAAFHEMSKAHGSYAEYALAPAATTFLLPPDVSYEAGAALPLAAMTAALALYQYLRLPLPTVPGDKDIPLIIYGGASAVGAYALQLAKLSRISPIITVAGAGIGFVRSLGAATHIVDYRKGDVARRILAALDGRKCALAFDAISGKGSYQSIAEVLVASGAGGGHINMVDPPEMDASLLPPGAGATYAFPDGVRMTRTYVASAYGEPSKYCGPEQAAGDAEFAYFFYRYLSRLLAEGKFRPHPFEVITGGMDGIIEGVRALHEGRVSAKKLVARWVDCCSLGRRCTFAEHYKVIDTPRLA